MFSVEAIGETLAGSIQSGHTLWYPSARECTFTRHVCFLEKVSDKDVQMRKTDEVENRGILRLNERETNLDSRNGEDENSEAGDYYVNIENLERGANQAETRGEPK
ncbi:hypothetical protein QAD02_010405 [Eretmocerus hayati]|uniref:Uncharacterized protein n=1 Tax=Eretmocerus hayati TaxID=131215 RepID=A0ACC2NTP1_9HYME|nr:hypothetical protein QAD02_010405 [Eretmocerus hayati]